MDIFKDLGIGIPSGLKTTEKNDLVSIVNGAVANQDTVKTGIIDAMNSKLATTLTVDKTWTEIQSAISAYAVGKKFASGSTTSTNFTDSYTNYGDGTDVRYSLTVTGLSFTPSYIIAIRQAGSNSTIYQAMTSSLLSSVASVKVVICPLGASPSFYKMVASISITNTGFRLPVLDQNASYNWIAIE